MPESGTLCLTFHQRFTRVKICVCYLVFCHDCNLTNFVITLLETASWCWPRVLLELLAMLLAISNLSHQCLVLCFSVTSVPGIAESSNGTGDAHNVLSTSVTFRGKSDIVVYKGRLLGKAKLWFVLLILTVQSNLMALCMLIGYKYSHVSS